ncbi:MAG TPA: winged helix-turn-helix domain-containing protein [Candidatus Nitrosotenuis sp.]|nr:winged helix-turn-helix domain-containing protein [Candidatus Nitrosotenuis sp.]
MTVYEMVHKKEKPEEDAGDLLKPMFILKRFSDAFGKETEINKTSLQLQTRLRWNSFNRYLSLLVSKGFLHCRREDKVEFYSLTNQGRKFFSIMMIFLICLK